MIPAIQNTAAVLAGLQAETGIRWLHSDEFMRNRRIYGNIHRMSLQTIQLACSSKCPGIHYRTANATPILLTVKSEDTLDCLLKTIEQEIGPAQINFPEPLVIRNFCTQCGLVTEANVPEWKWLMSPLCSKCSGSFALAAIGRQPASRTGIHTGEDDEVRSERCRTAGLPGGTTIEVWPDQYPGDCYLMQMEGTLEELVTEITPL